MVPIHDQTPPRPLTPRPVHDRLLDPSQPPPEPLARSPRPTDPDDAWADICRQLAHDREWAELSVLLDTARP